MRVYEKGGRVAVQNWQPVGRLMYFPRLDSSGTSLPVYTVGWRITDDDSEQWSQRFLRFKGKKHGDVRGGAYVLKEAMLELIAYHGCVLETTAMTTALSSRSTKSNPSSVLAQAGKWISSEVGITWLPNIFTKQSHRSLHHITAAADRDAEVQNKYQCVQIQNYDHLFILDDFVTRGATFGEMVRALSAMNPSIRPIGLALGKNESATYAAGFSVRVDNSHIPEQWDRLWEKGRRKYL